MPPDPTATELKTCFRCGKEQPLQEYYWRDRSRGKRQGTCRTCVLAAERARNSTPEGKAKRREISAAYYRRHKERHKQAVYDWRERNPEKVREIGRRYYRNRPTKKLVNAQRRHRERATRDPELNEYARIVDRDPCAYCGGPSGEIEHIVPLSRGGANASHNITAACQSCNRKKHAKSLLLFLLERKI